MALFMHMTYRTQKPRMDTSATAGGEAATNWQSGDRRATGPWEADAK